MTAHDDPNSRPHTVTELRPSRRPGLYIIRLDEEMSMLCPDDVAARWRLQQGKELTGAEFVALQAEAEEALAKRLALELVAQAPRSARALVAALRRRGASRDAAVRAVNRLAELGYVDDSGYARQLVQKMQRQGRFGQSRMRAELARRGVGREVTEEVLATAVQPEAEREKALALARRRLPGLVELEPRQQAERLAAFLRRRGFDWATIRWCLAQVVPEVDITVENG
jgi:regulatory protein